MGKHLCQRFTRGAAARRFPDARTPGEVDAADSSPHLILRFPWKRSSPSQARSRRAHLSATMRKISLASGLMAVLYLFGGPLAASAQEVQLRRRGNSPDQERITREVNLIQLTVVVRDKQGHPIEDLKAEDFIVTDQGQRQEIKLFELVRFPEDVERGLRAIPLGPRLPPSERGRPRLQQRDEARESPEARYILIIFQPTMGFVARHYAIRATRKFLRERTSPQDWIAIMDGPKMVVPFRNDPQAALERLEKVARHWPRPYMYEYIPWTGKALSFLQGMGDQPNRKALVVFTGGRSPEWLVPTALETNVAIYPVDARGLVPVVPCGEASTPRPCFHGPSLAGQIMAEISALSRSHGMHWGAAQKTGGRYLANNNALGRIFDMVHEDSRSYYVLGYYLPELPADGRFHSIKVRVKRKGVRVRAKSGYYAPVSFAQFAQRDKPAYLYTALITERPFHDIEIIADGHVFPDPAKKNFDVAITCELRWAYPEKKTKLKQQAVMIMGIIEHEQSGRRAGTFYDTRSWSRSKWQIGDEDQTVRTARYNLLTRLPAGTYQMKIVAADLKTNVLGSATYRFEVPALSEEPFAISSLVLADRRLSETPGDPAGDGSHRQRVGKSTASLLGSDPLRLGDSRLVPNPSGVFRSDEKVFLLARVYPRQSGATYFDQNWQATATVRDRTGAAIAGPFPVAIPKSEGATPGIALAYTFDLEKLNIGEGNYLVELQLAERGTERRFSYGARFAVGIAEAAATLISR